MLTLIRIIGILVILEGILFIVRPDILKKAMSFFSKGQRLYITGALRIALAIIFFIAASGTRHQWIIIALGILLLISGISIFVIKLDKLKAMLAWWQQKSLLVLRAVAAIALVIGAIIIYAA